MQRRLGHRGGPSIQEEQLDHLSAAAEIELLKLLILYSSGLRSPIISLDFDEACSVLVARRIGVLHQQT